MVIKFHIRLLVLFFSILISTQAQAQFVSPVPFQSTLGTSPNLQIGNVVGNVKDISGDGRPEYLLFEIGNYASGAGVLSLRNGVSGAVIWSLSGFYETIYAPNVVVVGDKIVLRRIDQNWSPLSLEVLDSATGNVLQNLASTLGPAQFSSGVRIASDYNSDGVPEVFVGFYGSQILVYDLVNNAVLNNFLSVPGFFSIRESFGAAPCDVDGDKIFDIMVQFWVPNVEESVHVYSGKNGSMIQKKRFALGSNPRGYCLKDQTGDQADEFAVTSYLIPSTPTSYVPTKPVVQVFDGKTGALRFSHPVAGYAVVEPMGDVNGDGFQDYLVGSGQDYGGGQGFLYSGATGALLQNFNLNGSGISTPGGLGFGIASAGDLNADGRFDILMTAPFLQSGGVFAFDIPSGLKPTASFLFDGMGTPSATGVEPKIILEGSLSVGQMATLKITHAPANGQALLGLAFDRAQTPVTFPGNGQFALDLTSLTFIPIQFNALGEIAIPVPGGGGPLNIYTQVFAFDVLSPNGYYLSDLLRLDFQP